ncbi:glycosyltransferase family 4 protein [Sediminibacillus albus]|uniref:Glycosyl transferases group 1 n=1 Tax=Sediminibacillus albus TaxID=407036 RepID=A0A1G8ZH63_9BACI|nr:glycosyltransferase family 4 protein [Sediminibacillus albus]SDK13735.1 Glycosyl transferases group 1 [Sediminibacillus albus]
MKKVKLLFAGHDLKFANNLIKYFDSDENFEVNIDKWTGHSSHDEEHSLRMVQWADLIVCEWGLGNAVWYSQNKLPQQRLIVRMHMQEVNTNYPKQFDLNNIDKIVAISPYVYEEFFRVFKFPRQKMTMIYNVLDTEKFNIPKSESKYNLGFIGMSPKMKRLDLALDILEKLWYKDSNYKLFIKGKKPEEYPWLWKKEDEKAYYQQLYERIEKAPWKESVKFDGYGDDIPEWLTKIGYILSTSDFESFHMAPAEGMASGAFPIILNWDGSNTIYPNEYLLSSVNECVDKIWQVKRSEEQVNNTQEYVKKNFDIEKIGKEWKALISSLL